VQRQFDDPALNLPRQRLPFKLFLAQTRLFLRRP
jgi:hypothetical protein